MDQVKCPSCGATVFSAPIAENQQEVTLNCQYCGSQFQVNRDGYTMPVKKTQPAPSQHNVGIPAPPPGSLVKVSPKWLLTVGMIFGYLGAAGACCSIIAGLLNKNNELIHKVFGIAFLLLIFIMPLSILGRRCQIALKHRIEEEKAAAERWAQQSSQNKEQA
ncbi:hypothetical protein CLV59_103153 [Chitinophaga dinghuensis]|uniref:Uncharacterized protein n=1 Tax=Chitinophaga dinghuensis TaxID=1539050 RepID=A0A327W3G1_9BACT|nr:hypothetical protein [Chitinophaga dinghuensis]RAJ83193.1 hypothetical protein CLV59_103153 [Chitinophaga dinghuensis]